MFAVCTSSCFRVNFFFTNTLPATPDEMQHGLAPVNANRMYPAWMILLIRSCHQDPSTTVEESSGGPSY
jgi:hypothetical protein